MATNFEAAFAPVNRTLDVTTSSLRIVSDGIADLFDTYCQLSLAAIDAWLRAVQTVSVAFETPHLPQTAEIVRMRPRRA